jgi:hypothetical protein
VQKLIQRGKDKCKLIEMADGQTSKEAQDLVSFAAPNGVRYSPSRAFLPFLDLPIDQMPDLPACIKSKSAELSDQSVPQRQAVAAGKELAKQAVSGRLGFGGNSCLYAEPEISDAQPSRPSSGLHREYEALPQ